MDSLDFVLGAAFQQVTTRRSRVSTPPRYDKFQLERVFLFEARRILAVAVQSEKETVNLMAPPIDSLSVGKPNS